MWLSWNSLHSTTAFNVAPSETKNNARMPREGFSPKHKMHQFLITCTPRSWRFRNSAFPIQCKLMNIPPSILQRNDVSNLFTSGTSTRHVTVSFRDDLLIIQCLRLCKSRGHSFSTQCNGTHSIHNECIDFQTPTSTACWADIHRFKPRQ